MTRVEEIGQHAKSASRALICSSRIKDQALESIAEELEHHAREVIAANMLDLGLARQKNLSSSMVNRLALDEMRIRCMSEGLRQIARFPDPIGSVVFGETRPNGLQINKVRVPLGVIAIIYESRPNVTVDAAGLCLKAGNAVILRGGKEAINSNVCLVRIMQSAIEKAGLPKECIQLIEDTNRESATELMKLDSYIDVLIPRGGAGLIRTVKENSRVPIIETGVGNCHIYIDDSADIESAINIVNNAKASRPEVCNAVETVLVHEDIARVILPLLKSKLDEKNVEIRGCNRTVEMLNNNISLATELDWETEFLDYILSIKIVRNMDEAIEHISRYSTGHSEAILTQNYANAQRFSQQVDSSVVYINASTRFTDGGEFGLGAEIGISTQKLHARGPMGVNELTSTKFIVSGVGQTR